jgi:hypothetical protein
MKFEHLIAKNNRMSGIVSALEPSNPRRLFGDSVNQLPFSFISPLRT